MADKEEDIANHPLFRGRVANTVRIGSIRKEGGDYAGVWIVTCYDRDIPVWDESKNKKM